ncbi:MAG TPA: DMT family transporter [Rubrivivax sp.]|nr:DMT family transporter [Burkholderiales bacterium]HNU10977.1 DMT family transporter [Rubrivivax sp.]
MRLTPRIAALLTLPPFMWACNALIGRVLAPMVPPMLLNALRWALALVLLLPLGWGAVATRQRRAQILQRWRPLAVLGLLGVGAYNSLQYLALQTSTPINVTLIASSMPIWMLIVGALFFGERIRGAQALGGLLSMLGVLTVLLRGELGAVSSLHLVPGDLWMLLATLGWAFYSWLLARPTPSLAGEQRPSWNWAEFLLVQTLFGVFFASLAAGTEHALGAAWPQFNTTVLLGLVFIAVGPAVLAYRAWGLGVLAAGPSIAGFFNNLTPLFAALLSALWLGQPPQAYHGVAFALIVAGIVASNRP